MPQSKREAAVAELVRRLQFITVVNGYNSDAGKQIVYGEAPKFGPGDPPAALAIIIGETIPEAVQTNYVQESTPIEIQALVPADLDAPLLAVEGIISDIKGAVEIEGRAPGTSAARDRSLDGVCQPKGFTRGRTRALTREPGSTYCGSAIEYIAVLEERWGGAYVEEDT
jgi:hypothetical protein